MIDGGEHVTARPAIERSGDPGDLMIVVHAAPTALPGARKLVRRWLATLAWPTEIAEDIELAVNEAVANVVDHAYPPDASGIATLHAWVSADRRTLRRRVVVAITDRGRWAAHPPRIPRPTPAGTDWP